MENKDSHLIEHLDELRQRMINTWSVSYFFLVVVSIMITPPDFILDILVIRHYSFNGSLRIKCHHIQDCL
ncbi:UNVERIFIED_ORG: Sec-independent protein secretion pathway component TatC [Bacillus sp. B2I3]|nr:Sec-independent protein secretion pathway component TatC [Bacillus sp. B2I3]